MILRAVIYCRCSTEEESQKDALTKQVEEAKDCIGKNGWLLVDSYVESKSGTTTKGRTEYNRLFEELCQNQFDIVVVKSQDRLMRNVKDWYLFLDRLVTYGKRLYLYIEHKFYTPDDALITGIKAILAEEYSSELSKKINNAHKNRQRRGKIFIFPPNTYGLRKVSKGEYELVEEEAEVIRIMFHLVKNWGCGMIANILEENKMYDRQGNPFEGEAIRRIIRNPIRCGTVIQNKRHWDFRTKRMVKTSEEEWIIHKNAVPACVSEEEWLEANRAMDERAMARNVKGYKAKGGHIGKYDLSGKLKCGQCGASYYRCYRKKYKDSSYIIEWKCSSYLYHGKREEGCNNIFLNEEKLFTLLNEVCERCYQEEQIDSAGIVKKMLLILEKAIAKNSDSLKKKKLEEKLRQKKNMTNKLLDKLLRDVVSDTVYKSRRKELEDSIKEIEGELENFRTEEELKTAMGKRLQVIRGKLEGGLVKKAVVCEMIDQIETVIVFPDHLEIHFYFDRLLDFRRGAFSASVDDRKKMEKVMIVYCALPDDFVFQRQKETERERIVRYMKGNPHITAKEIAGIEGVSLSAVNYRIKKLKNQGRIRFDGQGGRGKWVVCEREEAK